MIKKNATATFIENKDQEKPLFDGTENVFSIPYIKILYAEDFCKAEDIDYCFIGFKKFNWFIQATRHGLTHCVKINKKGIHPDMYKDYIINISEV